MKISIVSSVSRRAFFTVALLAPAVASAHPDLPGHTHGFAAGLTHPLSGLDHLLAMTAVGLWAVQRAGRAIWAIPLAFVSLMVLGGMLGMAGLGQIPLIDQAVAASVLILGIFIATSARLPISTAILIIGLFAVFHGYAHGAEMPASASGLLYGLGFVIATAMLHLCGMAIGVAAQKTNSLKLVRCAGCAMALCGLGLMWSA